MARNDVYKSATCETTGVTLKICYDTDTESPRDWDNLGKMICWHRRYDLGDKHNFSEPREFLEEMAFSLARNIEWSEIQEKTNDQLMDIIKQHAIILPLYLYDHGGITMNTTGFSCPWDSGQVGWIYCTKEDFIKETGYTEKELFEEGKAEALLKGEVETYDQYLTGDVYGFVLEDEDGNQIDSCWGFYGSDPRTNGMADHIESKYHCLFEKLA